MTRRHVNGQYTKVDFTACKLLFASITINMAILAYFQHPIATTQSTLEVPLVQVQAMAIEPTPTPTPTETKKPAIAGEVVEKNAIDAYIIEVFGDKAQEAFAILECENKAHNPNATNHNRNGSIDRGVFQINSIHDKTHNQDMFNYKANVDYAYKIYARQGWSPWSCAHKVGVVPFYLK